jgi:hypothetical protein
LGLAEQVIELPGRFLVVAPEIPALLALLQREEGGVLVGPLRAGPDFVVALEGLAAGAAVLALRERRLQIRPIRFQAPPGRGALAVRQVITLSVIHLLLGL